MSENVCQEEEAAKVRASAGGAKAIGNMLPQASRACPAVGARSGSSGSRHTKRHHCRYHRTDTKAHSPGEMRNLEWRPTGPYITSLMPESYKSSPVKTGHP